MILKKKIEQLLNGKFEYEQPQLLFSKEKISLTMKAGETKRGEVYVGTEDNQKIRGYVTSSSRRVVPGMDHISGTTVRLPLGIDTVGLAPGENLKGWLCFTTNIGEARLPFEIEIEKEEIRSFSGVVGNLDEFVKVARDDFKEAFRIFKDASFTRILEKDPDTLLWSVQTAGDISASGRISHCRRQEGKSNHKCQRGGQRIL